MTTPQRPSSAAPNAPSRFSARAIDLGAVKEAAEARGRAKEEAASGKPVELSAPVSAESFEQDLVIRSTQVPVIVQLGSSRAPGSDEMLQAFSALAEAQRDSSVPISWVFRSVDVDTIPEIAQAFGVQAIPTVLALAEGRPLTSFEGSQPEDQIVRFVEAVLQATEGRLPGLPARGNGEPGEIGEEQVPEDPRLAEAAEALEQENYAQAVAAYDAILGDPSILPEVLREARSARATAVLLERAGEGTADEVDQLILQGRRSEGFDILIGQLKSAVGEEKDAVRTRLLELFALFEQSDPEIIDARTRMASALF